MTVLTDAPRRHDYVGTGATTAYPYQFLVFAETDLLVYQDGVLLGLNTHYSVSGVGQFTGGTVTMVVPPAEGSVLTIIADVPITQGTSFPEGYRFPGRTVEATLDRLTVLLRQFKDRLRHGVFSATTDPALDLTMPLPVPGKVWGWNADGTALVNVDQAPIGPVGPQGPQGDPGASAAPTTRQVSGGATIVNPTVIEFDQDTGFAVSQPVAGVARVRFVQASFLPGMMVAYGGATAPVGWLLCDGAAVSRTTYVDLFAAIGVAFGAGDGSTTFNVPDLRGRVPLGAGIGPGLTTRSLGAVGGEETHLLTTAELPTHSHTISPAYTQGPISAAFGASQIPFLGGATPIGTTAVGGNGAHNTMPPFLVAHAIIKT